MSEPARSPGAAKSARDLPAALRLLHPEMSLATPASGTTAHGLADNERVPRRFFGTFPGHHVELDGHGNDGETLVCWGTARMTMTGDRFGAEPNGRRATVPVFIAFADDLIASERFVFDPAELCAQSGVSTDAVRARPAGQPSAAAGR